MKRDLPRTTEDRELKRGDSPCEIIVSIKPLWTPLAAISRGSPREIISSVETLKVTPSCYFTGFTP